MCPRPGRRCVGIRAPTQPSAAPSQPAPWSRHRSPPSIFSHITLHCRSPLVTEGRRAVEGGMVTLCLGPSYTAVRAGPQLVPDPWEASC